MIGLIAIERFAFVGFYRGYFDGGQALGSRIVVGLEKNEPRLIRFVSPFSSTIVDMLAMLLDMVFNRTRWATKALVLTSSAEIIRAILSI